MKNDIRYFSQFISLMTPCNIAQTIGRDELHKLHHDYVVAQGNDYVGSTITVSERQKLEMHTGMELFRAGIVTPETNLKEKIKELGQVFHRHLPNQEFQIYTAERTTSSSVSVSFEKPNEGILVSFEDKLKHYLKRFPPHLIKKDIVQQEAWGEKSTKILCTAHYYIEVAGAGSEIQAKFELLYKWIKKNYLNRLDGVITTESNKNLIRSWGYQDLINEKLKNTASPTPCGKKHKI